MSVTHHTSVNYVRDPCNNNYGNSLPDSGNNIYHVSVMYCTLMSRCDYKGHHVIIASFKDASAKAKT